MLRDDAVALIRTRCSNRATDVLLEQTIVAELKMAQTELESALVLPWFLLTEIETAETIAHDERLKIPSDFIREPEEETSLWYYKVSDEGDPWKELDKDAYDKLKVKYSAQEGEPKAYALVGSYFRLKPTPDAIYPIKMIYYGRDVPLATNIENKWMKQCPDLMIAKAGLIIASQIVKDADAATGFARSLDEASGRYARLWEARDHTGRDYQMGESP